MSVDIFGYQTVRGGVVEGGSGREGKALDSRDNEELINPKISRVLRLRNLGVEG